MNKKSKAFTLAELLSTLTIIGIVAALTTPVLLTKTKQHEYRTAGKKAFSAINSAMQNINVRYNMLPEQYMNSSDAQKEIFYERLAEQLPVIKKDVDADGNKILYTSDGFVYHLVNTNEYYVDINADTKPTKVKDPKANWKQAKYNDEDDLFESVQWDDVELTDVFYIGFNPQNGRSIILPYIQNAPTVAFMLNNP